MSRSLPIPPQTPPIQLVHDFKISPSFAHIPSFGRKEVSLEHVRNSGTFSSAFADRVARVFSSSLLPPCRRLKRKSNLPSRKWFFFSIYALMEQYRFRFRHFCAETGALPPHPIHIWDARESNLPSRKWFFFSIYALMEKYRKWFFFSIYALMEQYRFRRLFQTNTRRQTSPPATATVSVHSQRQTESPTFPKKWLSARSTP